MPEDANELPKRFIQKLKTQGVVFQCSEENNVRAILDSDYDALAKDLGVFEDHRGRVWDFLQQHIVVSNEKSVKESLRPLLAFLKQIYLKKGNVSEIIPLLAILTSADEGNYWHVDYLCSLLTALQPGNHKSPYPLSVIKKIFEEDYFKAKPMAKVPSTFSPLIANTWKEILQDEQNAVFTREQKALLCQLVVREYQQDERITCVHLIMNQLRSPNYSKAFRSNVLALLVKLPNINAVKQFWKICRGILETAPNDPLIKEYWPKTCELWFNHLSNEKIKGLFDLINGDEDKKELLLHIVALSSLEQDLLSDDEFTFQLEKDLPKVVDKLIHYSVDDLKKLAHCYAELPYPTTNDLLQIHKRVTRDSITLEAALKEFRENPSAVLRRDYGFLSVARDMDFQRMLLESIVVDEGTQNRPLNASEMSRISLMMAYLKQLESGDVLVNGLRINKMSQTQLIDAFNDYETVGQLNDKQIVTLFALAAEIIGKTLKKYPHLAQQYDSMMMDIALMSQRKVLELGTGEGKTIFGLLRALIHRAQGKKIHMYSAKRSLSMRDQKESERVFHFANLKSAYLEPYSQSDTLTKHDVVYVTKGDYSLHHDYCDHKGEPIQIDRKNCVAIYDEFDFTLFDEGMQTDYNFAIDAGKSSQEMLWLLKAVNDFYDANKQKLSSQIENGKLYVYPDNVHDLVDFLTKEAGEHDNRRSDVERLKQGPFEELVCWIQEAHSAYYSKRHMDFALMPELIPSGEEMYPMRVIVPLTSENQKMKDSSFTGRIDQLVAERLNRSVVKDGEIPDIHYRRMSQTISAQVAAVRIKDYAVWEAFSGSFSTLQKQKLYEEYGAQVFRAPTNQRCLREWVTPEFFDTEEAWISRLAEQIKTSLREKKTVFIPPENDKTTLEFKDALKPHFSDGKGGFIPEWNQLLFVTNEDASANKELFEEIKGLEDWKNGEKQKGANLFSSMHGRGDDLRADDVILMKVKTENQGIQNGGRIARNGAKGRVHAFYLWPEIEKEHAAKLSYVRPRNKNIDAILAAINESNPIADKKARVHRELLYLNEFIFYLDNEGQQGFRIARAEYCHWFMSVSAKFNEKTDVDAKFLFLSLWVKEFNAIEQAWLEVSSDDKLIEQEKVAKIREKIAKSSSDFFELCADSVNGWQKLHVEKFKLPDEPKKFKTGNTSSLVSDNAIDPKNVLLIVQALSHMRVPDDVSRWNSLLNNLATLEKNPASYVAFSEEAESYESFEDFEKAVRSALQKVSTVQTPIQNSQKEERFWKAFDGRTMDLIPDLQSRLKENLQKIPSLQNKAKAVFGVIDFLAKFSEEQQTKWGMDYAEHLIDLVNIPMDYLAIRLSAEPMPFSCHQTLWKLAKLYTKGSSQRRHLLTSLNKAVCGDDKEIRLRWLGQCELLLQNSHANHDEAAFFTDICQVMQTCTDEIASSKFNKLLNHTLARWHRDRHGRYETLFCDLWHQLATTSQNLSDVLNYLPTDNSLGKLAFVWPNSYLQLDSDILKKQWPFLKEVISVLSSLPTKKAVKTLLMDGVIKLLQHSRHAVFHADIEYLKHIFVIFAKPENQMHLDRGHLSAVLQYQFPQLGNISLPQSKTFSQKIVNVLVDNNPHTAQWTSAQLQAYLSKLNQVIAMLLEPNQFWPLWNKDSLLIKDWSQAIQFMDCLVIYPQWIDQLLYDFCSSENLNVSKVELNLLASQLVTLYQMLNKCVLSSDTAKEIRNAFIKLTPEKRVEFLGLIERYGKSCIANPGLIAVLVKQISGGIFTPSSPALLPEGEGSVVMPSSSALPQEREGSEKEGLLGCEIICKAVNEEKQTEVFVESTSEFALNFSGEKAKKLDKLMTQYPEHARALLTDNVVDYWVKNEANISPYFTQVVALFYQLLKDHDNNITHLMSDERIRALFDFTSENPVMYQKRQIWMTLLWQEIWVSRKGFLWDKNENTQLLDAGFNQYLNFAQNVLSQEKSKDKGDLSSKQHATLLNLSRELKTIHTEAALGEQKVDDDPNNIGKLQDKMITVVGEYGSLWKSRARGKQLEKFQIRLEEVIQARTTDTSRYENVLSLIEEAKKTAIEEDKKAFFKQNRKGYSNYFNTLDRLYDLVLTHWVKDLKAVGAFVQHEEKFIKRVGNALTSLHTTFSESEKKDFAHLYALLDLQSPVSLRNGEQHASSAVSNNNQLANFDPKKKLFVLLVQLNHDLPRLPGHLATLAHMALSQAEALTSSKLNPFEKSLYELLTEIYRQVDTYDAGRKTSFAELKQILIDKMLGPDPHQNLLNEIERMKKTMIASDKVANQQAWFKMNRKGYSGYLRLLSDLEILITKNWVTNDPSAQTQQKDKAQLEKSFNAIKVDLLPEIAKIDREYGDKIMPVVFYQHQWDAVKKLDTLLLTNNLVNDHKALKQLLEIIPNTTLPGEVSALTDQLLRIGQELILHVPVTKVENVV